MIKSHISSLFKNTTRVWTVFGWKVPMYWTRIKDNPVVAQTAGVHCFHRECFSKLQHIRQRQIFALAPVYLKFQQLQNVSNSSNEILCRMAKSPMNAAGSVTFISAAPAVYFEIPDTLPVLSRENVSSVCCGLSKQFPNVQNDCKNKTALTWNRRQFRLHYYVECVWVHCWPRQRSERGQLRAGYKCNMS